MANNLDAVMPSIYAGLNIISRELIGMIPAVQRNATLERAAVGQTVNVPIVPAASGGNITPGALPPNDGDVAPETIPIAITKSKYSPVRWNGEEQRAIGAGGMYNMILARQFAESMRWLANQVEVDLMATAVNNASRAYGTAGTAPFGVKEDLTDFAGINQILDENGAPQNDRRLIVNSAARFNLEGKQSVLFKVNEAGGDRFLRDRVVGDVMNFGIGFTAGDTYHGKGTGAGFLANGENIQIGARNIPVDGGTGTVLPGDVVTFAGDPNKYVARGQSGGGAILELNRPGLRFPLADNAAATIGASYRPNVAFTPNALVLAARAPAAPDGGDSAEDVTFVVDPVSGLGFEIRLYRQYRQVKYEVALAWGTGAVQAEHIALLLG